MTNSTNQEAVAVAQEPKSGTGAQPASKLIGLYARKCEHGAGLASFLSECRQALERISRANTPCPTCEDSECAVHPSDLAPTAAPQPASSEGERERFEAWFTTTHDPKWRKFYRNNGEDEIMWYAWQARAAQQTAQPDAEREALLERAEREIEIFGDCPVSWLIRDLRDYINRGGK